jgi:hypothetical protein
MLSLTNNAENLDTLKMTFDGNLNGVVQILDTLNINFYDKINKLNQHEDILKAETEAVKSEHGLRYRH